MFLFMSDIQAVMSKFLNSLTIRINTLQNLINIDRTLSTVCKYQASVAHSCSVIIFYLVSRTVFAELCVQPIHHSMVGKLRNWHPSL